MGKSLCQLRFEHGKAGHPHVGGEILHRAVCVTIPCGPSPRGWGNLPLSNPRARALRAIPTWVGKSHRRGLYRRGAAGHPHVGGEICTSVHALAPRGGPSPRGWGNLKVCRERSERLRAIPTWVGKSPSVATSQNIPAGHPHVGGEIYLACHSFTGNLGPSPRGWGNHPRVILGKFPSRAIPTWVGKSEKPSRCLVHSPGHPHVGGEIGDHYVHAVT